ncbi:hypothetical protein LCM02_01710 [Lutimonas saemankumensis]|uniref:ComF family protein n=1 Tax=Lutimonas saemankumensis TaxID=483016 RepID=UPI001CD302F7|nr:hypothetical protein [Lutimonas saemankumensis]MCA0931147.1 hypothetical protein [Lutimonas saemankumensis]
MSEIPLTHHSFYTDNLLEISFKGRVNLFSGTSLMYFEKGGLVQKILFEIKYNQKPLLASFFGRWLGAQMLESRRFESVDLILPLPLHPEKKRQRGYNQSAYFGRALAETMGKEFRNDLLFRNTNAGSQTKKGRTARMYAIENEYSIKDEHFLINRHVLIADDVITSGATLESACTPFWNVQGIRLSFACIAFTP